MYKCVLIIIYVCTRLLSACVMIWWIIIIWVINRYVQGEARVTGVCLSWLALYPALAGSWCWQVSGWDTQVVTSAQFVSLKGQGSNPQDQCTTIEISFWNKLPISMCFFSGWLTLKSCFVCLYWDWQQSVGLNWIWYFLFLKLYYIHHYRLCVETWSLNF